MLVKDKFFIIKHVRLTLEPSWTAHEEELKLWEGAIKPLPPKDNAAHKGN